MDEEIVISIGADTAPFEAALTNLSKLADRFDKQLTNALASAVTSGKSFEDSLQKIGLSLAGMALGQGLKPLANLTGSLFSGMRGGITPFAKGGVVPFASGGVVSSPTYFPLGRGAGLMGEAGAEAILPLARGADGRLGVAAPGGRGGAPNVVFNVTTPDAASFRKSEAQIAGMLARAVTRGGRTL